MTAAKQHDVVSNHTVGGCEIVSIYRYHRSGDFRVAFFFYVRNVHTLNFWPRGTCMCSNRSP